MVNSLLSAAGNSKHSRYSGNCTRVRKRPKVCSEWNDGNTMTLIKLIQARPVLWDKSSQNQKTKECLWQEVSDSFEGRYSIMECKAKWANLRVSYNTNVARYRLTGKKIHWRFYNAMHFIRTMDTRQQQQQRTQSVSSTEDSMNDAASDESQLIKDELTADDREPVFLLSASNSPSLLETQMSKDPLAAPAPTPTAFSHLDFNATTGAQAPVAGSGQETKSKYKIFGEYIASELQNLPRHQADYVQRRLNHSLLTLLDEVALQSNGSAPPPRNSRNGMK